MGHNKELIRFGDLDLIFKVTAVENLKIHCGGQLFSLKSLLLVKIDFVDSPYRASESSFVNVLIIVGCKYFRRLGGYRTKTKKTKEGAIIP